MNKRLFNFFNRLVERGKRACLALFDSKIHKYKRLGAAVEVFSGVRHQDRQWVSVTADSTNLERNSIREVGLGIVARSIDYFNGFWPSLVLVFLVPVFSVILNFCVNGIHFKQANQMSELIGFQLTSAEVIGSIAGIVFAILVFSAEIQANRAEEDNSLLPFAFRRSKLLASASLVLGVILAILVSPSLAILNVSQRNWFGLLITLILIYVVAVNLLWNIWNTLRLSSASIIKEISSTIREDLAFRQKIQKRNNRMIEAFLTFLHNAGVTVDVYGRSRFWLLNLNGSDSEIPIKLDRRGVFSDFDLNAINRLIKYIRSKFPGFELVFCRIPMGTIREEDIFCYLKRIDAEEPLLEVQPNDIETPRANMENAPPRGFLPDHLQELKGMITDACRFSKESRNDFALDVIIAKLVTSAANRIQKGDIENAVERTNEIIAILEGWADREHSDYLIRCFDPGPGPFTKSIASTIAPIARAIGRSNDTDVAREFMPFIWRIGRLGIQKLDIELYQGYSTLLSIAYRQAMKPASEGGTQTDFRRVVADRVDEYCALNIIFLHLNQPDQFNENYLRLIPLFLSSMSQLIRDAVLLGRGGDACFFHDRMFRDDGGYRDRGHSDTPVEFARDAVHFTNILIAGWCTRILSNADDFAEAVTMAASRLLAETRKVEQDGLELIRLWEIYYNDDRRDQANPMSSILVRLQPDSWETKIEDFQRSLIVEGEFVDERWHTDGLIVLLASMSHFGNSQNLGMPDHVPNYFWEPDTVKRRLTELLVVEWMGVPADQQEAVVARVCDAIGNRLVRIRQRDVAHVATSQIDPTKVQEIRKFLELESQDQSVVHKMLTTYGMASSCIMTPLSLVNTMNVAKDRFIRDPVHYVVNFPEVMAQHARGQRMFMPLAAAEQELPVFGTSAVSPDNIRDIVEQIRTESSIEPNLIVIPCTHEFERGVFGTDRWERRSGNEIGIYHEGEWNGINVMTFPYHNPRHVLVMNSTLVFAPIDPQDDVFDFQLIPPTEQEVKRIIDQANTANATDVPSDRDIQVRCVLTIRPEIGFSDITGGFKVPLA